MTEEQVDRVVETLCEQLQAAIRLKGTQPEVPPPNVRDLGFDSASVKTGLLTGLKVPGIKIRNPACVKKTFPNFFQKLVTPPPHGLGVVVLDAKTGRKLAGEELFAD